MALILSARPESWIRRMNCSSRSPDMLRHVCSLADAPAAVQAGNMQIPHIYSLERRTETTPDLGTSHNSINNRFANVRSTSEQLSACIETQKAARDDMQVLKTGDSSVLIKIFHNLCRMYGCSFCSRNLTVRTSDLCM